MVTLSQSFRLPYRTFARASVGLFNADRYGVDLAVTHHLKDERFSLEGRIGCTGTGSWQKFEYHYGTHQRVTWSLGGSFYWPKYNTQVSLKAEQYLLGEIGGRIDLIRHFRYCSIGFYAMKAQGALKNGGFGFKWLFLLININVRMCGCFLLTTGVCLTTPVMNAIIIRGIKPRRMITSCNRINSTRTL